MSDQYIPDNVPSDILPSLKELSQKTIPHAPTFKAAADEIEKLRFSLDRIQDAILDHVEDYRTPYHDTLIMWREDALKALGKNND